MSFYNSLFLTYPTQSMAVAILLLLARRIDCWIVLLKKQREIDRSAISARSVASKRWGGCWGRSFWICDGIFLDRRNSPKMTCRVPFSKILLDSHLSNQKRTGVRTSVLRIQQSWTIDLHQDLSARVCCEITRKANHRQLIIFGAAPQQADSEDETQEATRSYYSRRWWF